MKHIYQFADKRTAADPPNPPVSDIILDEEEINDIMIQTAMKLPNPPVSDIILDEEDDAEITVTEKI